MTIRDSGAVSFSKGCRRVTVGERSIQWFRGLRIKVHRQEVVELEVVKMRNVRNDVHEIREL